MNLQFLNKINYNRKLRILRWLINRRKIQQKKERMQKEKKRTEHEKKRKEHEKKRTEHEKKIINQIYNEIYLEPMQKINMSNTIIKKICNNDLVEQLH